MVFSCQVCLSTTRDPKDWKTFFVKGETVLAGVGSRVSFCPRCCAPLNSSLMRLIARHVIVPIHNESYSEASVQ